MKTILSLFTTLAIAFTAQAGWQAPYIYTYTGDPTNVSTSIINPVTGSTVIDPVTGNQYIKAGAKGSNASYATFEQIYIGPQINLQATTAATSTLTLAAAPTAGDTITVGSQVYNYVSAISGTTTNQIVIGTVAVSATNTSAALGASGSAAGYYTTGTNTSASGSVSGTAVTVTAYATGSLGNGVATTGVFTNGTNSFSSTSTTGGYTQPTFTTAVSLPANAGRFNLTSADIIYVSGTCPAGATQAALYSGSATALTGTTTLLTGSGNLTTYTHIPASTTGIIINTGTTGANITFDIVVGGTSTLPYTVQPVVHLFKIPSL